MTGFDLPPIRGFDRSFQSPGLQGPGLDGPGLQGPGEPFQSPEVTGAKVPSFEALLPTDSGASSGAANPISGALADSLGHVRDLQNDAKDKVRAMVMGEDVELHDVMIASSKSEVAFNLLLEVRNKLVDAWEKLSRSSV